MSQPITGFEVRVSSGFYDDAMGECRSSSEASAATPVDEPPTLTGEPPFAARRFHESAERGPEASSAVEDLILACQRLNAPAPRAPLPPQAPATESCTEPVVSAVSSCLAGVGRVIVAAPTVAGAIVALAGGIACGVDLAKAHECLEKSKP